MRQLYRELPDLRCTEQCLNQGQRRGEEAEREEGKTYGTWLLSSVPEPETVRAQQVPPVTAEEYDSTHRGRFREESAKRSGNTAYTRLLVFIICAW